MQAGDRHSRRRFIQRAGATGALVAFGTLAGCGREGSSGSHDRAEGGNTDRGRTGGEAPAPDDPCADLTGLTPEEQSTREDAGYVAQTPDPSERCDNCEYWEAPENDTPCGGCSVISGPIHPLGTCDLWEAQS